MKIKSAVNCKLLFFFTLILFWYLSEKVITLIFCRKVMCALIDIAEGVYFFIQCRECRALITIDPGYFFPNLLLILILINLFKILKC